MSDPVLIAEFGLYYWFCDRDPTASENLQVPFLDNPTFVYAWKNTITNDFFWCFDNTTDAMIWAKTITPLNIAASLPENVLTVENLEDNLPENLTSTEIGTSRSYSLRSTPEFDTSYQPSISNDIMVTAAISLTSTLILAGTVNIQIDTGSGFQTVAQVSISGLAATNIQSTTFLVPIGAHYKLVQATGTSSIVSIQEITL